MIGFVSDFGFEFAKTPDDIGFAATSENDALPRPFKISVPLPSLARTEPEEKLTLAAPDDIDLKFIVIIRPLEPVNPGLGIIPSKLTVPLLLENDGS